MKQKFTLASVLVFFTLCLSGQKKELMQNNLHNTNRVKTYADLHFEHRINHEKHDDRQNLFLSAKAKARKLSDIKSAQAFKQRLDSIVEFTNTNVPDSKVYFIYDSYGNTTQETYYGWDNNTNVWLVIDKHVYTYNSNGNNTQYLYYTWDISTNAWVESYKYATTYDANGNRIQEIYSNWDIITNAWVASDKSDYTNDPNGNMTQVIYSGWNGSGWSPFFKYDYTYNSNGSMTQELDYSWDSNSNTWEGASNKTVFSYDANGNMTQEHLYYWDSNTNFWVDTYKNEYTYDANGNMTQERTYNWDDNTNTWVIFIQKSGGDYTYDANGNPTSAIYYDWNQTTSQLVPTEKDINSYDLAYSFANLVFPLGWYNPGYLVNKPLESTYYSWNTVSNSWDNTYKDVYYYSEISITSVPKKVVPGIEIYPNPVSDYIMVIGVTGVASLKIYNLQGMLILSKTLTTNESVNVSGMSKGVYYYNLTIDQKKQVGKIIKK